jgi:glycopeptide antibiotics resistance protein
MNVKISKLFNIIIKILLVCLVLHAALFPDLPQYANKGMSFRLVLYPLVASIGLIIYCAQRLRGKHIVNYAHASDALLTLSITSDMIGNTLNLFDTIVWWDDFMHVAASIPLVLAVGLLLRRNKMLSRPTIAGLALGFGAVFYILWEIAEYLAFVPNNPLEAPSAYRDTIGDLALSLLGSAIGALVVASLPRLRLKSKP